MHNPSYILAIIHDSQAKAYNPPFNSRNAETAVRQFMDSIAKPGTVLADHPEDFTLYQAGTFDELTGRLERTDPPIKLASGVQLAANLQLVGEN